MTLDKTIESRAEKRRVITVNPEFRVDQLENKAYKIVGHAAVFNSLAIIGGYYVESISPGAFTETIANDEIACLFNHDENYILGRNTSGTLRLSEDSVGLAIECDPPQTSLIDDLVLEPMRRGDLKSMSFGFYVLEESWDYTGDIPVRTISKAKVFEVSVVTFPAYEATDVSVRSAFIDAGIDYGALAGALVRSKAGALSADDVTLIQRSVEVLAGIAKAQERQGSDDAAQVRGMLELQHKRIRLAMLD